MSHHSNTAQALLRAYIGQAGVDTSNPDVVSEINAAVDLIVAAAREDVFAAIEKNPDIVIRYLEKTKEKSASQSKPATVKARKPLKIRGFIQREIQRHHSDKQLVCCELERGRLAALEDICDLKGWESERAEMEALRDLYWRAEMLPFGGGA
ncbi:hypothetical protein [Ferrimonas balearica]|uniref:hypothetical protein n=1 Tax=Ferrimonas balearica TaxID=44012 RepID=UPI001F15DB8A|nr:hypothetical protein [Ferrimonas balearica]MBY6095137.1 hypothetical protein [Ferrimonas balearica]